MNNPIWPPDYHTLYVRELLKANKTQAENAALRAELVEVKRSAQDAYDSLVLAHQEQLTELTRQRDLAVSALEELTGVWYGKAVSDMALKALAAIKESEV